MVDGWRGDPEFLQFVMSTQGPITDAALVGCGSPPPVALSKPRSQGVWNMDYWAWLHRLQDFVARWQARLPPSRQKECYIRIDSPLSLDQIRELRDGLDCPLPLSVESFLLQAASRLVFECKCVVSDFVEIPINGELFNYYLWGTNDNWHFEGSPGGMIKARECVIEDATYANSGLQEPECALDRALWRHGLPLIRVPDTDCLALWVHDPGHSNPAVVYLSHDGGSYLLSPTFDSFLEQWEYLGYDWGQQYLDPETGLMDVYSPAATRRRQLLGLGN
jgi:hypothetical protein